jgi:protein SCO1/2
VTFNIMFTFCGDTCPLVTANLRQVQELLGDRVGRDIFMHSITLTPELETPEILRAYAELHGVGPGWLFLTGAPADVHRPAAPRARLLEPRFHARGAGGRAHRLPRYGSEPLDRWTGCPALLPPPTIVKSILGSVLPAA